MGRSIILFVCLSVCSIVLSACETSTAPITDAKRANEAKWQEFFELWIGAPESELVSTWGTPEDVYEAADGTRILTYNVNRTQTTDGDFWGRDGQYYTGQTVRRECNIAVTISQQTVQKLRRVGNSCF